MPVSTETSEPEKMDLEKIIQTALSGETVPVILLDEEGKCPLARNLDALGWSIQENADMVHSPNPELAEYFSDLLTSPSNIELPERTIHIRANGNGERYIRMRPMRVRDHPFILLQLEDHTAYHEMTDQAPFGSIVYDTFFRCVDANKMAQTILGKTRKEILGGKYTDIFPAAVIHKLNLNEALENIRETGKSSRRRQAHLHKSDASVIGILSELSPIKEEEAVRYIVQTIQIVKEGLENVLQPGKRFGKYRLLRRLPVSNGSESEDPYFSGAFKEVWLAEELPNYFPPNGRQVALKVYKPFTALAPGPREKIKEMFGSLEDAFQYEVTVAINIQEIKEGLKKKMRDTTTTVRPLLRELHDLERFCEVYEVGIVPEFGLLYHYMAEEYAGGKSLLQIIHERKTLESAYAFRIFEKLIHSVAAIHSRDILHKDLTPANIIISDDDPEEVKITDIGFGGYFSEAEPKQGNLLYRAPEQINNAQSGIKSDIFSAAAVLYSMLFGHSPFGRRQDPREQIEEKILSGRVDIPDIPSLPRNANSALKKLFSKALSVDPGDRYTADELLEQVTQFQERYLVPSTGK